MSFIPSDAPNLWSWYKASSGIQVTGPNITGWNDLSGNGRHLALINTTAYPVLSSSLVGGNATWGTPNASPALYENGSAGLQTSGNMFSLATGGTMYVVFKHAGNDPSIARLISSALNFSLSRQDGIAVDNLFASVSDSNATYGQSPVNDGQWYVARLRVPSGGNAFYLSINQSAEIAGSMTSGHGFTPGPFLLFGDLGHQAVSEVVVYDKDQTVDEYTAVEYYLSQGTGAYTWSGALPTYVAQSRLTFPALPTIAVGDPDLDPGATSNNPGPIIYNSGNTNVATIVGGKIHAVAVGSTIIYADQSATPGYADAVTQQQILTVVTPVTAVLNFPALPGKVYGAADFAGGATSNSQASITYASDNTAVATIVGGNIHIVGAGTANITASQGATSGYTAAANVVQSLVVTPITAVLNFPALPSKTPTSANFATGATSNSPAPITYTSSNTAVATIVSGMIHIVGPGSTVITASQGSVNGYTAATSVPQTLLVTNPSTSAMNISNSANISSFDFTPTWDLSGVTPVLRLANQSAGSGLANCRFWFLAYGSDGVLFHSGALSSPDATGIWSTLNIAQAITQVQNHIAWGAGYKVLGYVNDGTTTYGPVEYDVTLCRPQGNVAGQANNFGAANAYLQTQCANRSLYVEDSTDTNYQGLVGTLVSKKYTLVYPIDDTGTIPAPFVNTSGTPTLQIPLGVDSDCYQFLLDIVMDYVINGSTIRIKYKYKASLNIFCSKSLCSILCGLEKMEKKILAGTCTASEQITLLLLSSKMNRLLGSMQQPNCGTDIGGLIREIEELGGFDCNC